MSKKLLDDIQLRTAREKIDERTFNLEDNLKDSEKLKSDNEIIIKKRITQFMESDSESLALDLNGYTEKEIEETIAGFTDNGYDIQQIDGVVFIKTQTPR